LWLKKLRNDVGSKLEVGPRQLVRLVNKKAIEAGITDHDEALLLLAQENGIRVADPRYRVPRPKVKQLEGYLASRRGGQLILPTSAQSKKSKYGKTKQTPLKRLLNFAGKYPEVFYDRLEDEINTAYSNPKLPNAVLMLSRKLVENLVHDVLEYKFGKQGQVSLYYDTAHRRAQDFSVLIENLENNKSQYPQDLQDQIDRFLDMVKPFRRDANSKAHKVIDYLDSMSQIRRLKVPEMTQILLKLVDRVK
jgi:hypothetical protein